VVRRLAARAPVVKARAVLEAYSRAGGALIAGGLAYSALFALLPAILLVIGLTGIVVHDPARRAEIVAALARHIPPLRDLFDLGLREVSEGAVQFSLVAVAGLIWGASRFYAALDDAFARIFRDDAPRGVVARTLRGIISVAALMAAFLGAVALTSLASFLEESLVAAEGGGGRTAARLVSPVLAAAVFAVGVAAVYRFVPPRRPTWKTLAPPALVVGIALAAFTDVFVYLAPRLIGSLAVYGAIAALFAALVWLSIGFQVLLLGAAWVRERMRIPAAAEA
jgi:membrane protein